MFAYHIRGFEGDGSRHRNAPSSRFQHEYRSRRDAGNDWWLTGRAAHSRQIVDDAVMTLDSLIPGSPSATLMT
jgi:hypothetical protein